MAEGLGTFLPSETAYKDPNTFKEALRAEGTKRASYLSSMDQFYAGLEETKRQFGETLGFKREELEAQKDYWGETISVQREGIAAGTEQWKAQLSAQREDRSSTLELGREELGFKREELELKREESRFLRPFYAKEFGGSYGGTMTSGFDPFSQGRVDRSAAGWQGSEGQPVTEIDFRELGGY